MNRNRSVASPPSPVCHYASSDLPGPTLRVGGGEEKNRKGRFLLDLIGRSADTGIISRLLWNQRQLGQTLLEPELVSARPSLGTSHTVKVALGITMVIEIGSQK